MTMLPVLLAAIAAGNTAPDFAVKSVDGEVLHLSEMVKEGPVVVVFFPKAFSRNCTKELTAYRERYSELDRKGARVIAISVDEPGALKKFKNELGAPYTFVSDPKGALAEKFGVLGFLVAARTTFVVGEGRKILHLSEGTAAVDPSAVIAAIPVPDGVRAVSNLETKN